MSNTANMYVHVCIPSWSLEYMIKNVLMFGKKHITVAKMAKKQNYKRNYPWNNQFSFKSI